jgi:alcohol dehydrogenase class IV
MYNSFSGKPFRKTIYFICRTGEFDSDEKAVEQLILGIETFNRGLDIPKLKDLPGVRKEDFEKIVELAMQNGSTPSNVQTVTAEDDLHTLEEAYNA